jgi:hypothetical protein
MPPPLIILLASAAVAIAAGVVLTLRSGADAVTGRRLAGPRQLAVGDLLDLDQPPDRPVRVVGRIRCPDPIITPQQDRLVALHRDVDVRLADGRWRTLERVRETRGFELWDHAGSLPLDPADAAEPLITIPYVWQGEPAELDESYRPALQRVEAETGMSADAARAITRTISVIDRLLVLARVAREEGGIRMAPPPGGFLIATLDLEDAMRLLGGPGRGRYVLGLALIALGVTAVVVGLGIGLVLGLVG